MRIFLFALLMLGAFIHVFPYPSLAQDDFQRFLDDLTNRVVNSWRCSGCVYQKSCGQWMKGEVP